MNNPLYDELLNLRYIPINEIDEELPPESVVLYFKNLSQLDKRISVEPIHGVQIDLQNQNPTIELEDYKATFCLGPSPYIPIVTIDPIEDFVDPRYPLSVTFTGTISRSDNYIPNEIVVNYNDLNKRATLVNDTQWTVTFDLRNVDQNLTDYVSVKANSIDVNSSIISGYSDIVTGQFNIIFLEVECTPSIDKVSCLCLDITKTYKVTVDDETITGTFDDIIEFFDSHGLYAYPGGLECDPCYGSTNKIYITIPVPIEEVPMLMSDLDGGGIVELPDPSQGRLFTVTENGNHLHTIIVPSYLYGVDIFDYLMVNTIGIKKTSEYGPGYNKYYYRNVLETSRQLTYTTNQVVNINDMGVISYNDESTLLNMIPLGFYLCFKPSEPVVCTSSTEGTAIFFGFPPLYTLPNLSMSYNGTPITLEELSMLDSPITMYEDAYGVRFSNMIEECMLFELNFDGEYFFPVSESNGIASESGDGYFKVSLAGQVFNPPNLVREFYDMDGYSVGDILKEDTEYNVRITAYNSNNARPNWNATVTFENNEYELYLGDSVTISFVTPSNNTWKNVAAKLDLSITSSFQISENDSHLALPDYTLKLYNLTGASSTWTHQGDVSEVINEDSYSSAHYYSLETPAYSKTGGPLTVQFDSAYAGLTTEQPFSATVDSSGLLTLDLSQLYPYDSGWTTSGLNFQYVNLVNSDNEVVTILQFKTHVQPVGLAVKQTDGTFTNTNSIRQTVNTPSREYKLGPFVGATKILLGAHQDGSGGSKLIRSETILDIVDGYAIWVPPTPTELYTPYVGSMTYKVTTLIITVREGETQYVNRLRQSADIKYEVVA